MKILSLSSCFPSSADADRGIFVLHRLAALAKLAQVDVLHPVGTFFGHSVFPLPAESIEQIAGLTVHHRKWFYIPRVFKHLDAALYARGVRPWLKDYIAREGRPDVLDVHFSWPDGVAGAILADLAHDS